MTNMRCWGMNTVHWTGAKPRLPIAYLLFPPWLLALFLVLKSLKLRLVLSAHFFGRILYPRLIGKQPMGARHSFPCARQRQRGFSLPPYAWPPVPLLPASNCAHASKVYFFPPVLCSTLARRSLTGIFFRCHQWLTTHHTDLDGVSLSLNSTTRGSRSDSGHSLTHSLSH